MSAGLFADRAGRAGCPSDLVLDRLSAGELGAEEGATRAHVASCPACTAHLRGNRLDATPHLDAAAMLRRIRERVGEPGPWQRLGQRLRRLWPAGGPVLALAAACAALVLVLAPPARRAPDDAGPAVRDKGGLTLRVHRMRGQGSEELVSGARLSPGARLRFVIDLPREGYVAILGIEQGGAMYRAWPTDAGAAAPLRPARREQVLPGAVALDESPSRETLYLVLCRGAGEPSRCAARGGPQPPRCPDGCSLSPFVLHKGGGPGGTP